MRNRDLRCPLSDPRADKADQGAGGRLGVLAPPRYDCDRTVTDDDH